MPAKLWLLISLRFLMALSAAAQMVVRGNAIVVRGRTVVNDPRGVRLTARSPRGTFIAYSHSLADVVVVRSDGTPYRTLPISEDLGNNAVLRIGWLDEERIWIEGHRSPSSGATCVWRIQDGKRIDVHEGAMFTPSPDGRRIAELEPDIGHRPSYVPGPRVLIDRRVVYPLRKTQGDFTKLSWSPDSSLLAVVESFDAGQQIVVISPEGRVRKRVVIPGKRISDLSWSGTTHLVVHQDKRSRTISVR